MSENKKYYYIKLKDNYFGRDNIKILEAQPSGYLYSLIILKLYVKSARYNGRLMMTDRIPYDPTNINTLAKVLGHDVAHIKEALKAAMDLDLVNILESGAIWMSDIQNFIGRSSTEADRIRHYRNDLTDGNNPVQMYDKSTPEKEKEKEKEIKGKNQGKKPISYPQRCLSCRSTLILPITLGAAKCQHCGANMNLNERNRRWEIV